MIELSLQSGENIAFIGDVHLDNRTPSVRIDDTLTVLMDKLSDIRDKCVKKNVRYVFFEGDLVNRIDISYEAVNLMIRMLQTYTDKGIQTFSILGNHDILRNSLAGFDKSPTKTLFETGLIRHISTKERVVINGIVEITPVDYTEMIPKADLAADVNILLAHAFFDKSGVLAEDGHNITKDMAEDLDYDFMFLGHDHEAYPVKTYGKTTVVRTGSVLRGTSHNYNMKRAPKFAVLHGLDTGMVTADSVEEVVIKHKPMKDITTSELAAKKAENPFQEVLKSLADKITKTDDDSTDRIYDVIMTDKDLPKENRELLLKYIGEEA